MPGNPHTGAELELGQADVPTYSSTVVVHCPCHKVCNYETVKPLHNIIHSTSCCATRLALSRLSTREPNQPCSQWLNKLPMQLKSCYILSSPQCVVLCHPV